MGSRSVPVSVLFSVLPSNSHNLHDLYMGRACYISRYEIWAGQGNLSGPFKTVPSRTFFT